MKVFGIDLAPIHIPFERRLQTFGVLIFLFVFFQGVSFVGVTLTLGLLFTQYYWISLLYLIWYYFDKDTPNEGGRFNYWLRNWSVWKNFANYFPMKLIKTTDLSLDKNYMFAVHPHGVMAYSSFGNFGTEGTGFSSLFPGLTPHLLVLKEQFIGPIMRELLMLTGTSAASKSNLKYILNNQGPCKHKGQICAIIIGGAAEAMESIPGEYRLILKNRKGFCRVAIETGANLVPVFSFNENELYNALKVHENSRLRKFQTIVKKISNFGLPIFWARGIFNYSFGMIPFRKPLYTVVGRPIDVIKNENPTDDDVNKLHSLYMNELKKLFDENKEKYLDNTKAKLEIL